MCPDAPAYYGNRAACYLMVGDYKSALEDSRTAIVLDATFEKGYVRIVKCCLAMGDVVGAEQAIKRFTEIDAKNTVLQGEIQNCKSLRVHGEKADASYQQQDYRTAVYHTDSALKIAPASIKYKLLKAECLAMLGRIDVSTISFYVLNLN